MSRGILFHLHKFARNFSYLARAPLSELEIRLSDDYSLARLPTFPHAACAGGSGLSWPFANLCPPTKTQRQARYEINSGADNALGPKVFLFELHINLCRPRQSERRHCGLFVPFGCINVDSSYLSFIMSEFIWMICNQILLLSTMNVMNKHYILKHIIRVCC